MVHVQKHGINIGNLKKYCNTMVLVKKKKQKKKNGITTMKHVKNMTFQWYMSKNNCNAIVQVIKHGINEKTWYYHGKCSEKCGITMGNV